LFHFDPASLANLIAKADLRCVSVDLGHTPLVGRSLGYLFARDISNTGLLGLATYPLQVTLDVLAGNSATLRARAIANG
jgi:hypothetical protein